MTTDAGAPADDEAESESDFSAWAIFEVGLPIMILVLAWIIASIAFDINNAFISTFGSGDLLPISTLILIGCTAEIEHALAFGKVRSGRSKLLKQKNLNTGIIVLAALIFGSIKGAGLQALDVLPKTTASTEKLYGFAFATIGIATFQVVIAWLSKTKLSEMKVKEVGGGQ